MPGRFPSLSTRPPLSRPRMSSTARGWRSAVVRRLLSHSLFSGSSSKIASRMGTVALNTPGALASERNRAVAPDRGGATTNTGLSITAAVSHLTAPARDDPIAHRPRTRRDSGPTPLGHGERRRTSPAVGPAALRGDGRLRDRGVPGARPLRQRGRAGPPGRRDLADPDRFVRTP